MRRLWPTHSEKAAAPGPTGRLGGVRRRLLLLAGLGAAAAAEAVRAPARALAAGYVVGVHGTAPAGVGVHGESASGIGVGGKSGSRIAVYGLSATGFGVLGESDPGQAVRGDSASGYGVVGQATTGVGVYGYAADGHAVRGQSPGSNANNYAVVAAGANNGPGPWCNGDFFVTNGGKYAAFEARSHGLRALAALESPGHWFEDFGTATLQNGQARVDLEPVFAETVNASVAYHVFLTPGSRSTRGLAVTSKDAGGFVVEEAQGGTGTFPFDYRVVARVCGREHERLRQVDAPSAASADDSRRPPGPGADAPAPTPSPLPARSPTPGPPSPPPAT